MKQVIAVDQDEQALFIPQETDEQNLTQDGNAQQAKIRIQMNKMLTQMVKLGASDIHLQAGGPPFVRVNGTIQPLANTTDLTPEQTEHIALAMMAPTQQEMFMHGHEIDFAITLPKVARFRCNAFRQRGAVGMAMRIIHDQIPSFKNLGLPHDVVTNFASKPRGLVLVTGATGSGKSTTLAAIIDYINQNFPRHIITIEDPIEILHKNKRSLVVQREIGQDTATFANGVKYAMRQDPDVLMIGEMRDKETVEAAITAAQTGHLVFSTLHTLDTVRTINRIVDLFPPHERSHIRTIFAESLLGILSQRLLPRADKAGRVLTLEVLLNTPLIRDYVKDAAKTPLVKEALLEDNIRGMHTFDQHLVELHVAEKISYKDALSAATSQQEFRLMLSKRTGKSFNYWESEGMN